MIGKTVLLATVLAALLLPAPALAQTVSEGLIEVVGTLDLDALAEAAKDAPWLEGGVEQVITRLASGQAALTANEALRWGLDTGAEIGLSTVAFFPGGWRVLDGPLREFEQQIVQMDRRQRRATVRTEILGHPRRLRFGITEALP